MNDQQTPAELGSVSLARTDRATLLVRFIGPWHLKRNVPSAKVVERELQSSLPVKRLSFDTSELTKWDSGLIGFLVQTSAACRARGVDQDRAGLPEGLRRLLELAEAVPEKRVPAALKSGHRSSNESAKPRSAMASRLTTLCPFSAS